MAVRMDTTQFNGGHFECACGQAHEYNFRTNSLCQGYFKFVVVCPDDSNLLTCLKAKMFLMTKFKGFKSLSGYRIESDEDKKAVMSALHYSLR